MAAVNDAAGYVGAIFTTALDSWAAKMVFLIATVGQLFCGAAGLTSASRTWYAFSRDRAMPGWSIFRRVNRDRVPFNAVIAVSVVLADHRDPGAVREEQHPVRVLRADRDLHRGPLHRLRHPGLPAAAGRRPFKTGPWNLGGQYKWVNSSAIFFVVLVVFALDLPYTPAGLPWNDDFDASLVNYTPLAILFPLIFGVWYLVSAKN